MTAPADAVSTSPSRGGLTNINMYVLEVIEAAILGLVFGLGAFWFEFISPDQIVNIVFGFVLGYVVLLFLTWLWQLSQVARIAL
ncbi:MAG: hypothetical protein GWN33_10320, partial [Gammaproteobacteria bacterium]|nr:hypothetical protein [Gammaproteobacteria bacterium]NIW95329.1 hypothetical protein [Phycisphaerae bacterium]